jgi:hypothetical protein
VYVFHSPSFYIRYLFILIFSNRRLVTKTVSKISCTSTQTHHGRAHWPKWKFSSVTSWAKITSKPPIRKSHPGQCVMVSSFPLLVTGSNPSFSLWWPRQMDHVTDNWPRYGRWKGVSRTLHCMFLDSLGGYTTEEVFVTAKSEEVG